MSSDCSLDSYQDPLFSLFLSVLCVCVHINSEKLASVFHRCRVSKTSVRVVSAVNS